MNFFRFIPHTETKKRVYLCQYSETLSEIKLLNMINLEELISCFDSRFVNKEITELSWYKKHFNQGFLGFLVIWKINLTCPPFFSWNCHEKREGIIITRRRHDRLPLWKRLLVLGLWLQWHLKSQCIYIPRNLFKRKGKPKINLTKRVKKDDLTPLQTFIHVLTQGGNLRLNMSWHL